MPYIKTIAITRPREDAEALAGMLKKKGFHCIIEPLLSIKPVIKDKAKLKAALKRNPQTLLITSKHALPVFARLSRRRDIPVIATGQTTASHARALGFKVAAIAEGDARSLATCIQKHCKAAGGPLLYLRGEDISFELAVALERWKFATDSVILYKAEALQKFSASFIKAIENEALDTVLFFSRRTADIYVKLAKKHKLKNSHKRMTAVTLSKAISEGLKPLPWADIHNSAKAGLKSIVNKVNSLGRIVH